MSSVKQHYDQHLGPVYTWMAGGLEQALARGEAELEAIGARPGAGAVAVDLGAGFGMHAIPLARRGFEVLALEACAALLAELREAAGALPVRAVEADLLAYPQHLSARAELVLCMGDTLTHLPDTAAVEALVDALGHSIAPGGRFVATFRDYTAPLAAEQRFIPVRSDADRILTCFLEHEDSHVHVHDLLHSRDGGEWRLSVSRYPKLRLAPDRLASILEAAGFEVRREPGPGGMIRFIARRG